MKVLLLAGEESGLLYANRIAAEIRRREPAVEIRGYADYGFKTADLAVMGFGAVLRRLFYFLRVKRVLTRAIAMWRPDVVCTVDYPGMNLRLAAFAKRRGIRTVHVVCPQVWAWKRGRIPKIEAALDRLCCFFPFEPQLFKPGFASFVGHPLAEEMRDLVVARGARRAEKVLALLPGSRIGEIERNLPTMVAAAARLSEVKVVIPAVHAAARTAIERLVAAVSIPIEIRDGGAREVLCQADAAIVASGTATLEAALATCPTVLVYRVSAIFYWIAKHVIKGVKHIGLANIIAEKAEIEPPMPELIQGDFTPDNILRFVRPWLTDEAAGAAVRRALAKTMELLRSDGDSIARIVTVLGL